MSPQDRKEFMKLTKAQLITRIEQEMEFSQAQKRSATHDINQLKDRLTAHLGEEARLTTEVARLERVATKLIIQRNRMEAKMNRAKQRVAVLDTKAAKAGPKAFKAACDERDDALDKLGIEQKGSSFLRRDLYAMMQSRKHWRIAALINMTCVVIMAVAAWVLS